MSTSTAAPTVAPTLSITRRGRFVLRLVIVLAALLLVGTVTGVVWSQQPLSAAVASDHLDDRVYEQIVVQPGDTLWEISARLAHDTDQGVMLEQILAYNDLETSQLEIGQILYVPVVDPQTTNQ